MKTLVLILSAVLMVATAPALYAHGNKKADEGGVKYSTSIKPIFEKNCASCHGAESPEHGEFTMNKDKYMSMGKGPRMSEYTLLISFVGWPDTGAIMRRLDDGKGRADGTPGNMYQYLGNTEGERQQNLETFKKWVGFWSTKRWKEITKDELDSLKVRY